MTTTLQIINPLPNQEEFHTVVKNHPIIFIVTSSVALQDDQFKISLLYYNENQIRHEVPFVTTPTFYSSVHLDQFKKRATVEVRIKVLSSKHENMKFQVLIQVENPNQEYMEVLSKPILVISKPGSNKRVKRKPPKTLGAVLENFMLNPQKETKIADKQKLHIQEHDFETQFIKLLNSFHQLPEEDRPNKIRRILDQTKLQNTDFVQLLTIESSHNWNEFKQSVMKDLKTLELPVSLETFAK